MIGDAPLSKYTSVPGWETEAEEEALIYLAQTYVSNGGCVVEIGGEYGRSASEFGYALKNKKRVRIFTIDLFPSTHHFASQYGGLLNVWKQNIAATGFDEYPRVHAWRDHLTDTDIDWSLMFFPIQGDSSIIGKDWTGQPIDLLFVDGDHSLNGVRRDISAWVHHVKAGGAVAFHDVWKDENSHYLHREVLQAIDEYFNHATQEWERHDAPDSLLYFVRKVETHKAVESSASTPEKPAKKTRKLRAKKTS